MKLLFEYPQSPMTDIQSQLLIICSTAKAEQQALMVEDIKKAADFIWRLIESHENVYGMKIDNMLKVFICAGLMPNPGELGLVTKAISIIKERRGVDVVTILDFVMYFSDGFPSPETMQLAYQEAKDAARAQG